MQPSHLPFAWLKIIEGFRHQQQDTLLLQVFAFMPEQTSSLSRSTAFFDTHLTIHYLDKLLNPGFALLDIKQTGTPGRRTLAASINAVKIWQ